jgi:hypothetical protein
LLQYEPAQVSLLFGEWNDFLKHLQQFGEAERLIQDKPELLSRSPCHKRLCRLLVV